MGMYAWWCAAHVDLEANIREFCLHAGNLHLKFDDQTWRLYLHGASELEMLIGCRTENS